MYLKQAASCKPDSIILGNNDSKVRIAEHRGSTGDW